MEKMNKKLMFFVLLIAICFLGGCGEERFLDVVIEEPEQEVDDEEPVEEREQIIPFWSNPNSYHLSNNIRCPLGNIDNFSNLYGTLEGSKWRLILDINGKDTIDYSCNSIIYHFCDDGIVTIESDMKEFPDGEFTYNFHEPDNLLCIPFCEDWCCICSAYEDTNFSIGEDSYSCSATGNLLSLLYLEYTEEDYLVTITYRKEKIFYKVE